MSAFRNRMANSRNMYQGPRKRVLCCCSAGLLRSPTSAWILSNEPWGFNTRAVGCTPEYALIPIDEALVFWADEIVVMDGIQELLVRDLLLKAYRSPEQANAVPVHIISVPDIYECRQPELIEVLTEKFKEIWPNPIAIA